MGYYLETSGLTGKAESLAKMYGAVGMDQDLAEITVGLKHGAVICVVRNPEFEAAAFCYSPAEFARFTHPLDPRPKRWMWIEDREMVEKLTGYAQDMAAIAEDE
jgi:hypothetical protein